MIWNKKSEKIEIKNQESVQESVMVDFIQLEKSEYLAIIEEKDKEINKLKDDHRWCESTILALKEDIQRVRQHHSETIDRYEKIIKHMEEHNGNTPKTTRKTEQPKTDRGQNGPGHCSCHGI